MQAATDVRPQSPKAATMMEKAELTALALVAELSGSAAATMADCATMGQAATVGSAARAGAKRAQRQRVSRSEVRRSWVALCWCCGVRRSTRGTPAG